MSETETHAALLAALMQRRGLSKVDIAKALGLPDPARGGRVTVTRWLKGQVPTEPIPLERFADRLVAIERQLAASNSSAGD